jgi:hypothetical protein
MKSEIYDSLATINHATEQIVQHLAKLAGLGILHSNFLEFRTACIEEIRSHTNLTVSLHLAHTEMKDAYEFGKQQIQVMERLRSL